jgi:pyruvate kinase
MSIEQLEKELMTIHQYLVDHEEAANTIAQNVHKKYRLSAKNLFRYVLLRNFDLRKIHDSLSELGLSSLRSAEGYVYSNISNVIQLTHLLQGKEWKIDENIESIGYKQSKKLLRKHAKNLFVETHKKRRTEIMVTLPAEAGEDIELMRSLVNEGMEIARINLGRDDMEIWKKLLHNFRTVREESGIPMKVYMDLSGPKLRIADIQIEKEEGKIRKHIRVRSGEELIITKEPSKGAMPVYNEAGEQIQPGKIGVLLPQIIDDVAVGDRIFFDDGKIKGKVIKKTEDEITLKINIASKSKLSSQKGINLPDTKLSLSALTEHDRFLLPFVCENADMIGYSFVQRPEDIRALYDALDALGVTDIGVIVKVETNSAFDHLPIILFEAMKREKIGVMIARGDLAVEIGFERISEVQNEILWLCEAGHIPVIWATQVLQNLSKKGIATRAEVSDAAISSQAECVMLNKGPYIIESIRTLKSIIKRMEKHYTKKKSKLRVLQVAEKTLEELHIDKPAITQEDIKDQ